jgi:reactive chlorine resistance protein C
MQSPVLGRYGLVVVIGWIGALKFANFEAYQIQPLVANSPFMGWLYDFLPVYTFSALLGVVELAAAVLLAIKPLAPKLSIVGSLLAIVLFISTVSFLFTTPGVGEPAGGRLPCHLAHRGVLAQRHSAARPFILDARGRD